MRILAARPKKRSKKPGDLPEQATGLLGSPRFMHRTHEKGWRAGRDSNPQTTTLVAPVRQGRVCQFLITAALRGQGLERSH